MEFVSEKYPEWTPLGTIDSEDSYQLKTEAGVRLTNEIVKNKVEYYKTPWIDTSQLSYFNFAENL